MLRLYDTRTRQAENMGRGRLRMYICGPTVYRFAHVGNLRTYLMSDLIQRVLELHGVRTLTCQNITDVGHLADDAEIDPSGEDKILIQARKEGKTALDVARFYEDAFNADTGALNIRPPDHSPRATESIDLMISLVDTLIARGHAYASPDGCVYFDAHSYPSYGEISGNRLDALQPGHRVRGIDERKRFHADWALWRAQGHHERELAWDSPWSRGFPGWHVECSAMSLHHLGEHVDIHTGGIDLRFPHHEDERAQSNAAVGHEVVRHWIHGEHLLFEGRKMAKATGNVVLLSDVRDAGMDPLAVRLALLEHRHRQQMNLTWDTLRAADQLLGRWRGRVAEWAEAPSAALPAGRVRPALDALDDDLDTPTALRVMRSLERASDILPGAKFEAFVYLDRVLALDLARDIGKSRSLPPGGAELLESRAQARTAKDWATSDRLRDELAAIGVKVLDTPEGQRWHRP